MQKGFIKRREVFTKPFLYYFYAL